MDHFLAELSVSQGLCPLNPPLGPKDLGSGVVFHQQTDQLDHPHASDLSSALTEVLKEMNVVINQFCWRWSSLFGWLKPVPVLDESR